MRRMTVEACRLMLGLLIVIFHRHIADFILPHEESLVVLFRQRGVPVPTVPTRQTAHNIYFGLGVFVCLLEFVRIWTML